MKAVPFEVVLPKLKEAPHFDVLRFFLKAFREGCKNTSYVRRLVATEALSVMSDGITCISCIRVTGIIVVPENHPDPDPRDDKWGFYPALRELREMLGDVIPRKSLFVRQMGALFRITAHKRDLTGQTDLESPPSDGCDGGLAVQMTEEVDDQPTTSAHT